MMLAMIREHARATMEPNSHIVLVCRKHESVGDLGYCDHTVTDVEGQGEYHRYDHVHHGNEDRGGACRADRVEQYRESEQDDAE